MKKPLLFRCIILAGMLLAIVCTGVKAQVNPGDYTITKRVEISLLGATKTYLFQSDWLEGRFNNRLHRFEFRMPLQYVRALQNAADLSVFNTVFMDNPDALPDADNMMQLWVYLPNGSGNQNFEAYRNPVMITLAADCIINGKTYRTPIAMNLFFSGNLLKYGLDLNMDTVFETAASNTTFSGGPLRRLQLLVRESEMKVSFEQ